MDRPAPGDRRTACPERGRRGPGRRPRGPTAGLPGTSGTRSRGCWSAGPRAGRSRGAGQVALDGEPPEVASHRFVTARGRRRGAASAWTPGADLSAARPRACRVAALLQRVRAVPRDRLQAAPARPEDDAPRRAAVRGLGPRLVQARDRRRRACRGRLQRRCRPDGIRDGLARGSPEQARSARNGGPDVACRPTIYRAGSRRATTA